MLCHTKENKTYIYLFLSGKIPASIFQKIKFERQDLYSILAMVIKELLFKQEKITAENIILGCGNTTTLLAYMDLQDEIDKRSSKAPI